MFENIQRGVACSRSAELTLREESKLFSNGNCGNLDGRLDSR